MSEIRRTGILNFLETSTGTQFVVPVYQRNYTWESNKEVKQYLDDLKNVLKGEYKNHFLGIIIYLQNEIDFSAREFSVIDGQQRLTTTFLLLYVIRNLFLEREEIDLAKRLEAQFLLNPLHKNIYHKLKPLVSDDDVYKCIVEDRFNDIKDLNSNVIRNYNYIHDYIIDLIDEGYDLNSVLLSLNKLNVVVIPLSNDDNPQKIFESINATGVKLTAADLIRNYLLMELPSETQDNYYYKYWRKYEKNVSKNSKVLELFFRMYLAIKEYNLVSKNSVYREFIIWHKRHVTLLEDLLEDLLKYSKIFKILYYEDILVIPKEIKTEIEDFRKMDSDLPLPLFMKFYELYADNKLNINTLSDLYHLINSYMIRRSICDINSQNISRLFPSVLKKVLEKSNDNYSDLLQNLEYELVTKNINTSGSYMPNDKQMMNMLTEANVYKRPALRIILERMEMNENPIQIHFENLSIEHLMPQTPTEEWLEELDVELDDYNDYLHRLGNLTLASKPDNSKMKNKLWTYKNEILKDTLHLKLNMKLFDIERWNINEIEKRTKEIIETICKLYPYPNCHPIDENLDIVDEKSALSKCMNILNSNNKLESIRKKIYKDINSTNGYVITTSKVYYQGNRHKFWFAYRGKYIEMINECENKYQVLICRDTSLNIISVPIDILEKYKDRMNYSSDENGEIRHYHIVVFIDDGKAKLMLSKPTIEEIDISEYIIL